MKWTLSYYESLPGKQSYLIVNELNFKSRGLGSSPGWIITFCFVKVITWFQVQFGIKSKINLFQRLAKLHEHIGLVQFVVFKKI